MPQPKMWPYRILGLDQDGTVAAAHAAHKSLCARLGDGEMDRARRARYDAALAWCVAHWLDGPAASMDLVPVSRTMPGAGHARPADTPPSSRKPSPPVARPVALSAPPPSAPRSALDLLAIRRARAAYKAAQEALEQQPEVRTWRA